MSTSWIAQSTTGQGRGLPPASSWLPLTIASAKKSAVPCGVIWSSCRSTVRPFPALILAISR